MAIHSQSVEAAFGPQAESYLSSKVHSEGPDLRAAAELFASLAPARALDLGTGGGHLAYLLAAHAKEVIAADLSSEMLTTVQAEAARRGILNLQPCLSAVEDLPLPDAEFDLIASRYSAHHWSNFEAGLREARCVSKRGATALFIDTAAPESPLVDTHLQSIELLRDRSHLRNRSAAEWTASLARAGFAIEELRFFPLHLEFSSWVARIKTPPLLVEALTLLQREAPAEVKARLAIQNDGSFTQDVIYIRARAA